MWNGPVGVFEFDAFGKGTETLAHAIAESKAFSIAGGGDTLAAVDKYGIADGISYISTGGGAFLEFLEGKTAGRRRPESARPYGLTDSCRSPLQGPAGFTLRRFCKILCGVFANSNENVYIRARLRGGPGGTGDGGDDQRRGAGGGVSVASVSRALNGSASVTAETRRRIRGVAERLRYVPHAAARSLITRRTHTIGALLPDLLRRILFRADPRHRSGRARARAASAGFQFARRCGGSRGGAARDAGSRGWHADHVAARGCRVSCANICRTALPTVLINTRRRRHGLRVAQHRQLRRRARDGAALLGTRHRRDRVHHRPGRQLRRGRAPERATALRSRHRPASRSTSVAGDFTEESGYRAGSSLLAHRDAARRPCSPPTT